MRDVLELWSKDPDVTFWIGYGVATVTWWLIWGRNCRK